MSYLKKYEPYQKSTAVTYSEVPQLYFAAEAWLMLYLLIRMSDRSTTTDGQNAFAPMRYKSSVVGSETGAIFVGYLEIGTNKVFIPYIPVTNQHSKGMLVTFAPTERDRVQNVCKKYMQENADMHVFLDEGRYVPITCMFHHHVSAGPGMSGTLELSADMYSNPTPRNDGESFKANTSQGTSPHISLIGCLSSLHDFDMSYINDREASTELTSTVSNNFFMIYNSPSQQTFRYRQYALLPKTKVPIITEADLLDEDEAVEASKTGELVCLDLEITTGTMFGNYAMYSTYAPLLASERITFATLLSVFFQLIPNAAERLYAVARMKEHKIMGMLQEHILSTAISFTSEEAAKKQAEGGAGSNAEVSALVRTVLKSKI